MNPDDIDAIASLVEAEIGKARAETAHVYRGVLEGCLHTMAYLMGTDYPAFIAAEYERLNNAAE